MTQKRKTTAERMASMLAVDEAENIQPVGPSRSSRPRKRKAEQLSSISVPLSLLYRLRRLSLEASEQEQRHVPPYELIARALDAQKSGDS